MFVGKKALRLFKRAIVISQQAIRDSSVDNACFLKAKVR